jgi:hypothetical protein
VTILGGSLLLIVTVLLWLVGRFMYARRLARRVLPRTGEIWSMDGQPLYVVRVTNQGLQLRLGGAGEGTT